MKRTPLNTLKSWFQGAPRRVTWIAAACVALALTMISCSTLTRTILAPPSIPGATFVGNDTCGQCHETIVRDFKTADHARLKAEGKNAVNIGCESCHGPGSVHVEKGGGRGSIVNPSRSPETCFQCHLEVRTKFSLPNHHPLAEGKVTCSDCHNPHKGGAVKGGGTEFMGKNETCFQCHTAQRGPFVFPHEAVREGCTTCHEPHGSINQRMLTERNQALCLKCHVDKAFMAGHASRLAQGTCWSAGCHEAVHGSQVSKTLRY
ncbi:MAG: multiheme c-type cytochrome [Verrucomicrobia bacterium]|nr:multiheme c-type cytochrome [Verrucomicrobiota bacterium]